MLLASLHHRAHMTANFLQLGLGHILAYVVDQKGPMLLEFIIETCGDSLRHDFHQFAHLPCLLPQSLIILALVVDDTFLDKLLYSHSDLLLLLRTG